jgi:hypothetical protein
MSWNKYAAVQYAKDHAYSHSHGKCEPFVKNAIRAGGLNIQGTASAKDMGLTLTAVGFQKVDGEPQLGDVVVIQSIINHPDGHACIYDGHRWVSDFAQNSMYPGAAYRKLKPYFQLYRHY